jgi:hypothetical protein
MDISRGASAAGIIVVVEFRSFRGVRGGPMTDQPTDQSRMRNAQRAGRKIEFRSSILLNHTVRFSMFLTGDGKWKESYRPKNIKDKTVHA